MPNNYFFVEGGKFHYIGGSVWHEPAEKELVCVVV